MASADRLAIADQAAVADHSVDPADLVRRRVKDRDRIATRGLHPDFADLATEMIATATAVGRQRMLDHEPTAGRAMKEDPIEIEAGRAPRDVGRLQLRAPMQCRIPRRSSRDSIPTATAS